MQRSAAGFFVAIVMLALLMPGCSDDSPTVPTLPPELEELLERPPPEIISSDVQINRSDEWGYHYIGWKVTIRSPKLYHLSCVEIRWYDKNDFQIEWDARFGSLLQGTYTYSAETRVKKEVWGRVIRREVEITSYL